LTQAAWPLFENVTPVDTASNTAGTPIPTGTPPYAMTLSPDKRTLYVLTTQPAVVPIGTRTEKPGTAIKLKGTPITTPEHLVQGVLIDHHTLVRIAPGLTSASARSSQRAHCHRYAHPSPSPRE
jgi:hypothetical protein